MGYKLINDLQIKKIESERDILKAGMEELSLTLKSLIRGIVGKDKNGDNLVDQLKDQIYSLNQYIDDLEQREHQHAWEAKCMNEFAQVLKFNHGSIKDYYMAIITRLVKCLRANQGALYLKKQDEETQRVWLELSATYAHESFTEKNHCVLPGEGLIGQCFLDKRHNLITSVPKGFLQIHSGLGASHPKSVLIFPLMAGDNCVGVVELASFLSIEKHHLNFVNRISDTIAHSIHGIQVNEETRQLLVIATEQYDSLRQQEEELRQSMEELSATQDQLHYQLNEIRNLKSELELRESVFGFTTILSESDAYGTITYVNDKLCEVSKYSREELIGKPHNIFRHPDMPPALFKLMWATIKTGKPFQGIVKNRAKDGSIYWVDAAIVPVKNENGEIVKYVGARYHLRNEELAQDMYEKQMKDLGLSV